MNELADQILGIGVYSVEEAAFYSRVQSQTMARWVFGDKRGNAVIERQLAGSADRVITFLDYIQALHIRQIRADTNCRIPLGKIREAVETARQSYGVQYPLAMDHTTYLTGNELVIKLGDDEYVQVTGKLAHHGMISQIVKIYMKDLTFNKEGLASKLRAGVFCGLDVVMDPAIRFGEPLLPSCGYTARSLWEAAKSEGSIERAAEAYGVTKDEVEAGYRFMESLSKAA